jgi:hypothetical protein
MSRSAIKKLNPDAMMTESDNPVKSCFVCNFTLIHHHEPKAKQSIPVQDWIAAALRASRWRYGIRPRVKPHQGAVRGRLCKNEAGQAPTAANAKRSPRLGMIAVAPKAFTAWRMLKARIESAASAFTALSPLVRNLAEPREHPVCGRMTSGANDHARNLPRSVFEPRRERFWD